MSVAASGADEMLLFFAHEKFTGFDLEGVGVRESIDSPKVLQIMHDGQICIDENW